MEINCENMEQKICTFCISQGTTRTVSLYHSTVPVSATQCEPHSRPLIWQQGALTRVEKMLLSFPCADFLVTGFPPQEEKGKEGSVFATSLL